MSLNVKNYLWAAVLGLAMLAAMGMMLVPAAPTAEAAGLSVKQAREALDPLMPGVAIISVEPAAVEGFHEVAVDFRGRKAVVYLDKSLKKILVGDLIDILTKRSYTQAKMQLLSRIDMAAIPLDGALVLGDPKAPNKVVVFDDPD
jgi:thiol:disulfide interchange protein DsbC